VKLGKQLTGGILPALSSGTLARDGATAAMVAEIRRA